MQKVNRLKPFFENLVFEREDNRMIVNFGPQHPSSHGQLRLVLELDGELVTKATPDVGYLHRGMEKMAENMIYNEFLPTTDRMDYIASTSNNYGFALAVEKLIDLNVPRRAKVIRMMLLELSRLTSHLFWIACHALDVGAMTIFLYAFREREYAMDLFEDYCGARLTGWTNSLMKFINEMPAAIETYEGLLDQNRIWKMRLEDVGIITPEMAQSWGCSGPMLRGSGIAWDIRKEEPYELYDEVEFDVPVSDRCDSYGRYKIHMQEMRESLRILKQLIPMYGETTPDLNLWQMHQNIYQLRKSRL